MPPTKTKEETNLKTTKEMQYLKVQLTQEEILAAGEALATAIDNTNRLQAEKESAAKAIKAKESALEAEITTQQLLVRNKYEHRNVPCESILDYNTLEAYTKRLDTGEEIMRRAMSEDEKQSTMSFDGEDE